MNQTSAQKNNQGGWTVLIVSVSDMKAGNGAAANA